jgi:hypothetical protein
MPSKGKIKGLYWEVGDGERERRLETWRVSDMHSGRNIGRRRSRMRGPVRCDVSRRSWARSGSGRGFRASHRVRRVVVVSVSEATTGTHRTLFKSLCIHLSRIPSMLRLECWLERVDTKRTTAWSHRTHLLCRSSYSRRTLLPSYFAHMHKRSHDFPTLCSRFLADAEDIARFLLYFSCAY